MSCQGLGLYLETALSRFEVITINALLTRWIFNWDFKIAKKGWVFRAKGKKFHLSSEIGFQIIQQLR